MRDPVLRFLPLLPLVLLAACSSAEPPAAHQSAPATDLLKGARSVEAATDAAAHSREEAVKAVKP